jgi:hypothetical protein
LERIDGADPATQYQIYRGAVNHAGELLRPPLRPMTARPVLVPAEALSPVPDVPRSR